MDQISVLIQIHVASAVLAMLSGLVVLLIEKGSKRHRYWARLYVASMLVTSGVVIFVPASVLEFGDSGWGFFHLFIGIGGISSLVGIFALWKWRRTGDKGWLRNHQVRFVFSYAGLLMAGLSQLVTNPRFGLVGVLTPLQFWISFIASNMLILAIAGYFVWRFLMRGDPARSEALKP